MIELHFREGVKDPRVFVDGSDVTMQCAEIQLFPLGLCRVWLFDDPPQVEEYSGEVVRHRRHGSYRAICG